MYIHIAFCPYICPYCDFAKELWTEARAKRYVQALTSEIQAAPPLPATTLFFGGGTPNTLPPQTIAEIVTLARARFLLLPGAEISIECNPDLALCEGFDIYAQAGITRLSFGVQSFVGSELKTLGRRHTGADVVEAVRRARAAGFAQISIDLIFGTPGQTLESLDYSIDAALALEVPHISAYGLTVEEDTPYEKWRLREPQLFDDDTKDAALYARLIERLAAAGFEQYELSNFARSGSRSQHNAQYWDNDEYLGFGTGAASYLDGIRSVRTKDYQSYVQAVERGEAVPCESEQLTGDARIGEAIMLALRRKEGVDMHTFCMRYGIDVLARYADTIAKWRDYELLEVDAAGFRLTPRGRFLANDVCAAFLAPVARA